MHLTSHQLFPSSLHSPSSADTSHYHTTSDIEKLIQIIELQNQTISALTQSQIQSTSLNPATSLTTAVIQQKDAEILNLKEKLNELTHRYEQEIKKSHHNPMTSSQSPQQGITSITSSSSNSVSSYSLSTPSTGFLNDCEERYGMKLIDNWKQNHQTWCLSTKTKYPSSLTCYPYTQKHKNSPDMFCEATNFMIDFSRVSGEYSEGKAPRGDQYLSFDTGSLVSTCQKTNLYRNNFMPHHTLQMRSAIFGASESDFTSAEVYETPLYLLARDEDCENSFHSTADFVRSTVS